MSLFRRMRPLFPLLLLTACVGDPESSLQDQTPEVVPGSGAPPGVGLGKLSEGEDLSAFWREDLAAAVPPPGNTEGCPDADADGFVDAFACPGGRPDLLDCNDADPKITPEVERYISAGPFLMGSESSQAGADEKPIHVVNVSGFCLDRYEVNSRDLAVWFQAQNRTPQGPDLRSLSPDGRLEQGRDKHPAEGVTWQEAHDYCVDHGQALPTEAQWEKAARGGCELGADPNRCDAQDLRPYPWGSAPPGCELANHQSTAGNLPRLCISDTVFVDKMPSGAGPYGHHNLAGNVWEYVADWWHPQVYGGVRSDPGGPPEGSAHVLRGGSWNTFSTNMRAANRFTDLIMGSAAGFRCARPSVAAVPDAVAPVKMVTLKGVIKAESGTLTGRALYVTVFDAADADPKTQMMAPGRSPLLDHRFTPNGEAEQTFTVQVPATAQVLVMAALDAGTGAQKDQYVSASGSGGFGSAEGNPLNGDKDRADILIHLKRPPAGGAAPAMGPGQANGPGGPQPPSGPQGPPPGQNLPPTPPSPDQTPSADPGRGMMLPSPSPKNAPAPQGPAPGK